MTPYDGSVEAEYEDGYTHSETELGDVSPYDPIRNILNDIIEKRPEAEHGRLVRFSLYHNDHRYDVDWTNLPDNARPIRFKHKRNVINERLQENGEWVTAGEPIEHLDSVDFGYQFTNDAGENVQEVIEVK